MTASDPERPRAAEPAPSLPPPRYIDSQESLLAWVERLEKAKVVAVDTESDSFHSYREKVCLVQMSADGVDVVIDPLAPLDLEPLRPLFADATRTKVFHDAGYDLMCLHRDYGFAVAGVFDTMVASRLLGNRVFGLAAILRDRFGFDADKRLQRSDWAQRPLSDAQISYARFDTHFLERLMQMLSSELETAHRLAWAQEEFARLPEAAVRAVERLASVNGDRFWRLKGVKALASKARGRARALYELRDRIAERLDRPAFKVFGDRVLLDLAITPPHTLAELGPRPGLQRGGVERFGREILVALRQAAPLTEAPPKGQGRRRAGRLLDPDARERYEVLRELRARRAAELGIEGDVLLGNALLEDLAKRPPTTLDELRARDDLSGWRFELLGTHVLRELVAGTSAHGHSAVDA
ncbi:MAG: HRDC domain-containing protein [Myxococcota bacterium]